MPDLSPDAWTAIALSFKVAAVATLWGVPVSIVLALILARGRFPGKALFDGLIHLPLVLPPVVTGYVLLLLLGRKGPIGAFLDQHFGRPTQAPSADSRRHRWIGHYSVLTGPRRWTR